MKNGCGILYRTRRGGREKPLLAEFLATTLAITTATAATLRLEPDGTAVVHRNGLGGEEELLFMCHG